MKNFDYNNFNRPMDGLKILSRCPVCPAEHNLSETAILDEIDEAHLLYIKCGKCHSGVVASISPGSFGMISLGVVTDLNALEIKEIKNQEKVSKNDVLDFYHYFKGRKTL
jgi:hypothetical protein